jgi:hypothetical protein
VNLPDQCSLVVFGDRIEERLGPVRGARSAGDSVAFGGRLIAQVQVGLRRVVIVDGRLRGVVAAADGLASRRGK